MSRAFVAAVLAALALALAACGGSPSAGDPDPDAPDSGDPLAGMCAPDMPDCVDVIMDPDGDAFDSDGERAEARGLLGLAEGELGAEVRVGRRGDELMMLTEDYVLGRDTVELDEDAAGVLRVVSVTVELPDGPETFAE